MIEAEFGQLLDSVQPTERLFKVARSMFEELWLRRLANAETQVKALGSELARIEKQVGQLLERILDATVPSVIAAYEERVRKLEEDRAVIRERMTGRAAPATSFDDALRTALDFIASPWNLWSSGKLDDQRAVLKLAFAKRLRYLRGEGFRTAELSLPFRVLSGALGVENGMARPGGFEPPTHSLEGYCSIQLS